MEEQLHRQQSWVPDGVEPGPVPRRKRQRLSLGQVYEFVQTYPLLVWGGIWVSILLVAAIALGGLLSPGVTEGRRATGAAFGSGATVDGELANGNGQVSFWLFGVIAITCTAGSILVSKRLSRGQTHRQISRPKRPKPYAAVVNRPKKARQTMPTRRPSPSRHQKPPQPSRPGSRLKRLKPFSPEDFAPLPTPQVAMPTPVPMVTEGPKSFAIAPSATGTPRHTRGNGKKPPTPKPTQVPVTVLPPEENHPLDWQDASIADAMDIRKRHSLSSWM